MSEFRCKPQNMQSNGQPYANHYSYGSSHPIDEMVSEAYFLPVRGQLRAADTIEISQHKNSDLNSDVVADAMVKVLSGGDSLKFRIVFDIEKYDEPKAEKPKVKKAA